MRKNIFNTLLISLLLSLSLYAKDSDKTIYNQNDVYFLPEQSNVVQNKIINLIENSHESIYIAMYNFSYKKFAKKLVQSAKKGVKITVILDKSKVKKDDKIYEYLKKNDIKVIVPNIKLHTKLALFDSKKLVLGSSNWTKASFKENYEIILFTSDKKVIKETKKFIKKL